MRFLLPLVRTANLIFFGYLLNDFIFVLPYMLWYVSIATV